MKRISLLLVYVLCTLLSSTSGRAQGFAPLGAEWTYHGFQDGPIGTEYLYRYKCVQADTQADKVIKTIEVSHYKQQIIYDTSGSVTYRYRDTAISSLLLYEENDTVWVYNSVFQKYTPLYIFNVQEGDTLRIPILDIHPTYPNATPEGDSVFVLIVDSIRTVNYGGVNAETYFVSNYMGDTTGINWQTMNGVEDLPNPIVNWTSYVSWTPVGDWASLTIPHGAYTRLFGGKGEGLLPERSYIPPPYVIFEGELRLNRIHCFSNDTLSFQIYQPQDGCDTFRYNRPLVVHSVNALKGVDVYPNPAQNTLVLQAQQLFAAHTSLSITDILGRTVVDKTLVAGKQQYTLSVTGWTAGTYILILEQNGQRYYRKVQVVH